MDLKHISKAITKEPPIKEYKLNIDKILGVDQYSPLSNRRMSSIRDLNSETSYPMTKSILDLRSKQPSETEINR